MLTCKGKYQVVSKNNDVELVKLEYENKLLQEKLKAEEKLNSIISEQAKTSNNLAVGNMCNVNGLIQNNTGLIQNNTGLIQNNNDLIETNMRSMTFLNKYVNDAPSLEHFNTDFKDPYIFYIDYAANKKLKDESKLDNSKVLILSKVKMKNGKTGSIVTYTLVPENEADLKAGKISIDSPISKGLLGKSVGDKAEIKVPSGIMEFEILEISR